MATAMVEAAIFQGLPWNPLADLRELFAYPFMVNALEAGTIVAVMGGVIGWFMVLRRQTFAGHTLSVIAFPGAAAASLAGLPLAVGYFGFCGLGALVLAGIAGSRRSLGAESAAIGSLQALALALGFLFVGLYHGILSGLDSLLFGTFLGITSRQVTVLLVVAAISVSLVLLAARPLFFASVDADVARAAGVPVRLLGFAFLLVLGLSVAETSQITGALLVFALLVTPAATAHELTSRPAVGIALSVAIAFAVTWLGLALAYYSIYPVGLWVTSLAFGVYVLVRLFVATIFGGVGMGLLGARARADDVVIGSLFAWTLGLGVLFLSIFTSRSSAGNGTAGVRVLFGSIFGLSSTDVTRAVVLAVVAGALLLAIARPLLFASLDTAVAAAQGVPVRALGLVFLALLGLVSAQATQAVGALLLLGLLAAPAGAAHRLTTRPYLGLALSALFSVGSIWIGLTLSYVFPTLPPSSMIIAAAVGVYVLALATTAARDPSAFWLRQANGNVA